MSPETAVRFVRPIVSQRPMWSVVEDGQVYAIAESPFDWDGQHGDPLGAVDEFVLAPPVAPSKIICVGRNYQAHAAEHSATVPDEPLLFLKPPSSLIGSGAPIVLPGQSKQVEHEGELGLVIGRRCRNLSVEEAESAIFGLVPANDVTARDLQRADGQWTRGKGFDTFCPVGPALIGGIDAETRNQLEVCCRVNGSVRQQGCTDQMAFSPEFLVSYISLIMTLEAGDLILTGTPAGVGPLFDGDVVEVEIGAIGRLTNPVVASVQ